MGTRNFHGIIAMATMTGHILIVTIDGNALNADLLVASVYLDTIPTIITTIRAWVRIILAAAMLPIIMMAAVFGADCATEAIAATAAVAAEV